MFTQLAVQGRQLPAASSALLSWALANPLTCSTLSLMTHFAGLHDRHLQSAARRRELSMVPRVREEGRKATPESVGGEQENWSVKNGGLAWDWVCHSRTQENGKCGMKGSAGNCPCKRMRR